MSPTRGHLILFILALAVAGVLRLAWIDDIEYKNDEKWTFEVTQQARVRAAWPLWGMDSSAGVVNPPLSIWVFVAPARLFGIDSPQGLARAVQLANLVALAALGVLVFGSFCSPAEKEEWLWAIVLLSVNPFAVLFARKIWPPAALALFNSLFLIAFRFRAKAWGALVWGLIGALLGQIQLVGAAFAAGVVCWTALFDRRSVRWRAWVAGSALGAIALVTWSKGFAYASHGRSPRLFLSPASAFSLPYFSGWITNALGDGLRYSLGAQFLFFERYPYIAGYPTFLALALIWLGRAVMIGLALFWGRDLALRPRPLKSLVADPRSPNGFVVQAALWGMGALVTLSMVSVARHYLTIVLPLAALWLARLVLRVSPRPRLVLGVLAASQAVLSALFLFHVHRSCGSPLGDYGTALRCQTTSSDPAH